MKNIKNSIDKARILLLYNNIPIGIARKSENFKTFAPNLKEFKVI
jgi:hypothetical protein